MPLLLLPLVIGVRAGCDSCFPLEPFELGSLTEVVSYLCMLIDECYSEPTCEDTKDK
jgi:hypothetical protein